MAIYSLYIINKAGGLIYNRDFVAADGAVNRLTSNEYLVLAGTVHGIHAITARLCPYNVQPTTPPSGLELLEASDFKMFCMQTLTGLKFLLITSPEVQQSTADAALRKLYEVYSDHAMKNPFYTPEMPIRVDQFEREVRRVVGLV